MDEIVALYDERGRPAGTAPRAQMRARNLRHAATAVVVRDPLGRVYLHRRTDTKDVYPGRWDFAAGGVVLAGEDPTEAAVREAEEELGVTSPLVALGEADYADDHTTYHAFRFVTEWDGEVRWQPEEVADGRWVTLAELVAVLADPDTPVMPDTAALLDGWLRERLADTSRPEQGWDSDTAILEGRWVERVPQRPDVAPALLAEVALMARLPELPLAVPRPKVVGQDPVRIRHRLVPGEPSDHLDAADGARVGAFLRALHDLPDEVWTGILDPAETRRWWADKVDRLESDVLPLVPGSHQPPAAAVLTDARRNTPVALTHADLGPLHLLADGDRVSGVIDWTDARVGDPALDLAWVLYGAPEPFARAVATAYGATDDELARALVWHRLGPWHEVIHGLDQGQPDYVESGLAGLVSRL
ncbi:MAG: phosphotransferase [Nocardioides sp.]